MTLSASLADTYFQILSLRERVIDDTALLKKGSASVGGAVQYCGATPMRGPLETWTTQTKPEIPQAEIGRRRARDSPPCG